MKSLLDKSVITAGLCAFIALFFCTVVRRRKLEVSDVGFFLSAFMSGCNIPAALFLCSYGFWPDDEAVHTKMHGAEKYVVLGGVALLSLACVSLWVLFSKIFDSTKSGS